MTLNEFLNYSGNKYAVISVESYNQDPIAQSISTNPRTFIKDGVELAVLSLEPVTIPQLVTYVEQVANGVEFELTLGSGKVTLLLHSQILDLLSNLDKTN